jgi:hypothetical protein
MLFWAFRLVHLSSSRQRIMRVSKLTCPKCEVVLRPSKPVKPGKKVTCPKCGTRFAVPGAETDVVAADPDTPSKPAGSGIPSLDDEDTGPATYKFIDEPEPAPKKRAFDEDEDDYDDDYEDEDEDDDDPDKKADLSIVPDLTVKDPRGIAQEKVMRPSNWLMASAVISIILELIRLGWVLIPFFFSIPEDTSLNTGPPVQQSKETSKEKELHKETYGLVLWLFVLLQILVSIIVFVYNGFIVYGTVRIQNLEGYGWGIAACILGILPLCSWCWIMSLISGIICLITLRSPDVIAGFEYKPE